MINSISYICFDDEDLDDDMLQQSHHKYSNMFPFDEDLLHSYKKYIISFRQYVFKIIMRKTIEMWYQVYLLKCHQKKQDI